MAEPHSPSRILQPKQWLSGVLLLGGMAGFAAAWTLLALATMRQCSWMAVIAAVDAVFLLRMSRMAPGWPRAAIAAVATLIAIALANWWIAGGQMGLSVGMTSLHALQRLGIDHARTLITLANDRIDVIWHVVGLAVAIWLGRVWSLATPSGRPD